MKSRCFKLYRPYSILFNSPNLGNFFLGLNSKRLDRSSEKEKESRCLVFTSSTKRERRSHAVTANKCTKRRDARAKSLFYQSKHISFLSFLLTSPSPLLKLPIIPPWWHKRFFKWLCFSCGGIVSNFIDYHTSFSLLFYHFYTLKHFSRVSTLVVSKRKDGRGWETIYENSAN